MRIFFLFAVIAITTSLTTASSQKAQAAPSKELRDKIVSSIVTNHIKPRYKKLAMVAKTLKIEVAKFCRQPTPKQLTKAQSAFKATMGGWMKIQHIKFGPVMKNDRTYRLQYWPDKHGQGAKHIRKIINDDTKFVQPPEKFRGTSVALQGFGALERYLFSSTSQILLTADATSNRLCGFVNASAANIADMTGQIDKEWQTPARTPSKQRLQVLFQMFNDQLLIIEKLKLLRPLGKSLKKSRSKKAESWRSHLSLINIANNLDGLSGLFDGENGGIGLKAGMVSEGETADFDKAISNQLKFVTQFSRSFDKTIFEAVSDKAARARVIFFKRQIAEIRSIAGEYLAPDLGVHVGFNALDGD